MAVPVDYQKYWNDGNAGIADAMPHINKAIQGAKPGNPNLEGYLNSKFQEFERRRLAGEDPDKITEELMQDFKQTMSGGPGTLGYAEGQASASPSVGVSNGITSLGDSNMQNLVSQPPESFPASPGSFTGLTPSPSAMGGGVSSGIGNTPPAPVTPSPQVNYSPQGAMPADNEGASVSGEKLASLPPAPGSASFEKPMEQPIPYEERPKISLTAGRDAGNKMNTGHGSPIPPMRTRGQQEEAMGDIERMSKVENSETALELKQKQLQFKTQLDIIKTRAKELRLSEKDKALILMSFEGLDAKKQMFVASEWARKLAEEHKFKLGQERVNVSKGKAANQMPMELKDAKENFHKAAGRATAYLSKDKVQINSDEAHRVNAEREETRKLYNKMVEAYNKEHGTTIATIDIDGRNVKPPVPTTGIDYEEE